MFMTSKCFIMFFAPNSRSNLCKGHGAVQINAECCNSKNTPGGNELCLVPKKHIIHIGTLFHGNDSDADFVALP